MPRQSFCRQRRSTANENYPFPEHLKMPPSTSGVSINAKSNTGPVPSPKLAMDADFFKVKTACLRKILDSVNRASSTLVEQLFIGGVHISKEVLKLKKLRTALKDQFAKTEESLQEVLSDDTVFDEFDKLEHFVWATEKAADGALLEYEKFLKENSIRISGANAVPASATSSTGRTNSSAAARSNKCPGRDPASAAARPGKNPGRDPASTAARPGKIRQAPRQRPGKYPGKTQQQHHASIAEAEAKAAAEAQAAAEAETAKKEAAAKAVAEAEAAAAEAKTIAEAEAATAKANAESKTIAEAKAPAADAKAIAEAEAATAKAIAEAETKATAEAKTIAEAKAAAAKAIAETKAKTHLLAKRVQESINKQTSACLNSEEIQELRELKTALEYQFVCMMETGGYATSGRDDAVFDDFDELVEVALSSADTAGKALAAHKATLTAQAAQAAQASQAAQAAQAAKDAQVLKVC